MDVHLLLLLVIYFYLILFFFYYFVSPTIWSAFALVCLYFSHLLSHYCDSCWFLLLLLLLTSMLPLLMHAYFVVNRT